MLTPQYDRSPPARRRRAADSGDDISDGDDCGPGASAPTRDDGSPMQSCDVVAAARRRANARVTGLDPVAVAAADETTPEPA
jgi:hypothetical protein